MRLEEIKHIHFSGIKGVGMTALALYAQDMGKTISGSDVAEEFVTEEVLRSRNLPISVGFDPKNLPSETDLLVYSAAHASNPQVSFSTKRKIPALSYAQALAEFTAGKKLIATCGVGGKSTTASLIATVLSQAQFRPSFIVGVGNIPNLSVPGKYDTGTYAVVEADDYVAVPGVDLTPKFLYLKPSIIVVTNIEFDHPDVYLSLVETQQAFVSFFRLLPEKGLLVANIDNKQVKAAISKLRSQRPDVRVETYGFSPEALWKIESLNSAARKTQVSIIFKGVKISLTLNLPGRFNAANACAALAVATQLGVSQRIAVDAVSKFRGTTRRFQYLGSYSGVEVWDDYAHHPSEITQTLRAARDWFKKKRIVVVFQPHTYSRTKALLEDFSRSLSLADEVIITQIYASAREKEDNSITGAMLAQRTREFLKNSKHLKQDQVLKYLKKTTGKSDVVLTMGAGDIYKVAKELTQKV